MLVKHKLFIVSITESAGNDVFDAKVLDEINSFLAEDNFVYLNHSISVVGKDVRMSGASYKPVALAVSLVYKDLNDSPNQVKRISSKSKKIIRTSIEENADIPKPNYKTEFDKKRGK